ncbi:MAG: START domain-containing protein [Deltaproteobacteria bacterium]|nr:START domain-containing protein [Deltaproteobacteria bacterium]
MRGRLKGMIKNRIIGFHTLLLIIIIGILSTPVVALSESEWTLVLQRDDIEVFTRAVTGSDLDEFLGTMIIDAPVNVVEAVIDDVPASPQWMADCREARTIRIIDENSSVVLNVTKTPWPVWDRETLVLSTKRRDVKMGTVVFQFHSVHDSTVPVGKKNVRIPAVDGQWVLSPVDKERTKVTYTVKSNPGGSIPKFIAAQRSRDIPYITLLGLKEMVKKKKYRGTAQQHN